jgi:hypothetical protein
MKEQHEVPLPRMVETRRDDGPGLEIDAELQVTSPLHHSQSSISSDQAPLSPTFSLRGHTKLPSTNSSLSSSPTMRSSLDFKRPLTEVKEEPQHEREDRGFHNATSRDSSKSRKKKPLICYRNLSIADPSAIW